LKYYESCPAPVFPRFVMFEGSPCAAKAAPPRGLPGAPGARGAPAAGLPPRSPRRPLGRERIAKLTMELMDASGINVCAFKAHALRGATATHLLSAGADPTCVRHRGGWMVSGDAFGVHYGRSHQAIVWERFFVPDENVCFPPSPGLPQEVLVHELFPRTAVKPNTSAAGVSKAVRPLPPTTSDHENEAGGRSVSGEVEGEGVGLWDAVVAALRLVGAVVAEDATNCFCGAATYWEAVYFCVPCNRRTHVRCLDLCPCGRGLPPELIPSAATGKRGRAGLELIKDKPSTPGGPGGGSRRTGPRRPPPRAADGRKDGRASTKVDGEHAGAPLQPARTSE
jgi:hypothetical protein